MMRRTASVFGFTLLEVLVVLVLFAITAAAAVPAFLGDALSTPEQRVATQLVAVLVQARDATRESGRATTVVLSPSDARYWISRGDSTTVGVIPLEGAVTLVATSAERVECAFHPAGTAKPCVVAVHGATDIVVRVNGWNGEIALGENRAR